MTERAPVTVVGLDAAGRSLLTFVLAHGEDPETGLRRRGVDPTGPLRATGSTSPHAVTLEYRVTGGSVPPEPVPTRVRVDPDLVRRRGETATAYQRVAVYAVARSPHGVLLTQNSARTSTPGRWSLPGGGMDPGELPEQSLHREVWEETGQHVVTAGLAAVTSQHWVGRAPHGRLEDFHAVRIVYWADCAAPTDPVVHDADGTTVAAAWVPVERLEVIGLTTAWADLLPRLVTGLTAPPPGSAR